jgi:nucleotide-binding universal stress UspA family protein
MTVAIEPAGRHATLDTAYEAAPTGHTILTPLDGSAFGEAALVPAAALAARLGAHVVLMRSVTPAAVPGVDEALALQLGETDARASLARAASHAALAGVPVTEVVVLPAAGAAPDTAAAILTAVNDFGVDLVVMSTHGRTGIRRAVFGSVAEAVLRRSPVPVLLIHPPPGAPQAPEAPEAPEALPAQAGVGGLDAPATAEPARQCVLVALDGSPGSTRMLEPVGRLAAALGLGVVLLRVTPERHLLPGPGASAAAGTRGPWEHLNTIRMELSRQYPDLPFIRTEVCVATPARVPATINERARRNGARMIALASHGRAGLSRLLFGSVTAGVVAGAAIPILAVPPQPAAR